MNITFPLILDGAMGTQIQKKGFKSGECPEVWDLEHKNEVFEIQKAYVDAGSQILYTPTFGANAAVLEKNGQFNKAFEFNTKLAEISKEAAGGKALIAGDISSTGGLLYPLGDMSFDDLYDIYKEQAEALEAAGVDLFVIETMTNLPEARAALLAVKSVSEKPVFVSFSCDENGRTMTGTDVCAALLVIQGMGADAFGLNCSTGPKEMAAQIKRLSEYAEVPLIAKPNAGFPHDESGKTVYDVPADEFKEYVPLLADAGAKIFGSCCGSDENFIKAIKEALAGIELKETSPAHPELLPCATEKDVFLLDPAAAYENVLACGEDLEDDLYELEPGELFAVEITSPEELAAFSDAQYAIKNPLCIICSDAELLENTLRAYQGRALYEGSLSDEELLPLVSKYGLII